MSNDHSKNMLFRVFHRWSSILFLSFGCGLLVIAMNLWLNRFGFWMGIQWNHGMDEEYSFLFVLD
jgi:hypothetical protein